MRAVAPLLLLMGAVMPQASAALKTLPLGVRRVAPSQRPAVPSGKQVGAAAAGLLPVLPAFADDGAPILGGFFETPEARELGVYLAQTVISWGVPAAVALVFVIIASPGRSGGGADEKQLPPELAKLLGVSKEPKEYLQIERLNTKLASFDYSFAKATVSKESALRASEQRTLEQRFGAELASFGLESDKVREINKVVDKYREAEVKLTKQLSAKVRELRALSLSKPGGAKGKGTVVVVGEGGDTDVNTTASGALSALTPPFMKSAVPNQKDVANLQRQQLSNELSLLAALSTILSAEQASRLAAILKPTGATSAADPGGAGLSALSTLAEAAAAPRAAAKHVYVLNFFGDVTASQVSTLRQEVTAVLRNADASRGDEVVLVLNTGGGTVTGYGLAASQLRRLKEAGIRLTVCVEQVAASGGYLMACTADTILASPFAVIGSIGVITEQPNVYERLQKEGISFSTVTAGKFKRTLTPTKKFDAKDFQKTKDDVEQILLLFKRFVQKNRPQLDIELVATGETWLGFDALDKQLVDGLTTVDELLLQRVEEDAEVYGVKYVQKPKSPLAALTGNAAAAEALGSALGSALGRGASGGLVSLPVEMLARVLSPRGGAGYSPLAAAETTADLEREMLAARPSDEAEPMMRWGGEVEDQTESWHL